MEIATALRDSPDDIVTFESDPTVRDLIKDISEKGRFLAQTEFKVVGLTQQSTHWILAMILMPSGAREPVYRAVCLPKSKYAEGDVIEHFDEYTREILPFDAE